MAIAIICPGCHSRFSVADKFGGKQGPCPKCKTIINIPRADQQVKIHAPELHGAGGKDSTGAPVLKPIVRKQFKFNANWAVAIGGATVLVVGLAFMIGQNYKAPQKVEKVESKAEKDLDRLGWTPPSTPSTQVATSPTEQPSDATTGVPSWILGIGAVLLAFPLVLGGYEILRNDELGAYRGRSLWIRAAICSAVYAGLWGLYFILTSQNIIQTGSAQVWIFAGPPFVVAGAAAAFFCLDLEFGSSVFHYGMYLLTTVLLRWIMGVGPL